MIRPLTRLSLLGAAITLAACGYTAGLSLEAEGVRTVAITVVGNETYRQRSERPLTRALNELLPLHTGMHPAAAERADARLEVEIVDIRGRSLVQGGQDPVREGSLDFVVHVQLIDRRSGRTLRERTILDRAEFRSPVGEDQDRANREAARDLARKIVLALEPDF